jgi:hypothetical protein
MPDAPPAAVERIPVNLRTEGSLDTAKWITGILSVPSPDEECPLTLDKMSDYSLEFLPDQAFMDRLPGYRKLTLPCSHSFSAMAIVYHFARNNLQCPMCRSGHMERMSDSCIPSHIRVPFLEHLRKVRAEEQIELETQDHIIALSMSDPVENIMRLFDNAAILVQQYPLNLSVFAYDNEDDLCPVLSISFPMFAHTTRLISGGEDMLFATLPSHLARTFRHSLHSLPGVHRFTFVVSTRNVVNAVTQLDISPMIDLNMSVRVAPGRVQDSQFEIAMLQGTSERQIENIRWSIPERHAGPLLQNSIFTESLRSLNNLRIISINPAVVLVT